MMTIEILKPIKIGGVNRIKDDVIDVEDSAGKIYVSKGFAKKTKKAK